MITYTKYFKETWLPIYIKQYRENSYKTRKAIKDNVYKNVHLKEYEKDDIWAEITRRGNTKNIYKIKN